MSGSQRFKNFFTGINRTSENLISSVLNKSNSVNETDSVQIDKDRSASTSTVGAGDVSDFSDAQSEHAEGFLCPQCLAAFPNGVLLTEHFSSEHSMLFDGESSINCFHCKMRFTNERELTLHVAKYHETVDATSVDKENLIDYLHTDKGVQSENFDAIELSLKQEQIDSLKQEIDIHKCKLSEIQEMLNISNLSNEDLKNHTSELEIEIIKMRSDNENIIFELQHKLKMKDELLKQEKAAKEENNERSMELLLEKFKTTIVDNSQCNLNENVSLQNYQSLLDTFENLRHTWSDDRTKLNDELSKKEELIKNLNETIDSLKLELNNQLKIHQQKENKIQILDEKCSNLTNENKSLLALVETLDGEKQLRIQTEIKLRNEIEKSKQIKIELKLLFESSTKLTDCYVDLQAKHEKLDGFFKNIVVLLDEKLNKCFLLNRKYHSINQELEAKLNNCEITSQANFAQLSALQTAYDDHLLLCQQQMKSIKNESIKLKTQADVFYLFLNEIKPQFQFIVDTIFNMKNVLSVHFSNITQLLVDYIKKLEENYRSKSIEQAKQFNNEKFLFEKSVFDLIRNNIPQVEQKKFEIINICLMKFEEKTFSVHDSVARLLLTIKKLIQRFNNERNELLTQIEKQNARFDNAQQFHDKTLGEKLKLEIELSTFMEEKRALLERCVAVEENLDKSKTEIVDLSKNLDDSIKAVHELALQNQTLQIQLEQCCDKMKRTWTDDKLVSNCMNKRCNKQFTTVIRKHHCRYCGDIFCSDCSSKTAQITGHPNPVRVCDTCHNELNP